MITRDFNENDYEALLALDDENELQFLRGASPSDIARLPTFRIPSSHKQKNQDDSIQYCNDKVGKDLMNKTCPVCLENFIEEDVVCTLPCLHQFHKECVSKWLRIRATCPVCQVHVF